MDITINDVAREARVSAATVSYVLNQKKLDRITTGTRRRVLKAAKKLNYYPHASARGLASNKTQSIGVSINKIDFLSFLYFSVIIGGISRVVGDYDYNLHFTITDNKAKGSRKNLFFMRKVAERRLDGLIIIDQWIGDEDIMELKKRRFPFVLIDRDIPGEEINSVGTDNKEGILQATEHLIRLGHKRIGFILEVMKFYKIKEMLAGYRLALSRHGLKYERGLVKESAPNMEKAYKRTEELLRLPQRPTAIITSSDKIALQALTAIKDNGLRVPQDMALVGYNDEPLIAQLEPQLSTVKVPLQEMGKIATEILFNIINNGKMVKEPRILLKPELVVRKSSGGRIG